MKPLTEKQLDVLRDLASMKDNPRQNSRELTWEGIDPSVYGYWAAPMDFGGTDGSHHSTTARRLAELGLVERYKNGKINSFNSRNKGSCCYRISDEGIAYLAALKEQTP